MSWSQRYERFAHILDGVEKYTSADDVEPRRRNGTTLHVELQYDNGDDEWASELRRMADEVETLREELSPEELGVRTYTDTVQVSLTFELDENVGEQA